MAFFKFGAAGDSEQQVLLELVSPRTPGAAVSLPGLPAIASGTDAPAKIAGLVVTVPRLEPVAELLGADRVGRIRPAMQGKGRQIAPYRHEEAGLLPLAFITPPTDAGGSGR